jgi:hypothetical protein
MVRNKNSLYMFYFVEHKLEGYDEELFDNDDEHDEHSSG